MKKIAIATITGDNTTEVNYGNKLQAFALQRFLRNEGFLPETLHYKAITPQYTQAMKPEKKRKSLQQIADDTIRVIKRKIYKNKIEKKRRSRLDKFKDFQNKNMVYSEEMYEFGGDFSSIGGKYDYFITGSDQVWNPYYEGYNPFYYLGYAPKGKRIAYAPSIAVDNIPDELEENFGKWVREIDFLSIREEGGKKLLKEKYNIDSTIVCDPVFLLDEEQWTDVAQAPDIKNKYFVVYILGKKNVLINKLIKQYEKKFKAKAIDIYQWDNPDAFFAGPEEFVGLIKNSEFVFTNSFHGAAFSAIFKKPLVLIEREAVSDKRKMTSRMSMLLDLIGAENRDAKFIIKNPNQMFDMYSSEQSKLDLLIAQSKAYLLSALGI